MVAASWTQPKVYFLLHIGCASYSSSSGRCSLSSRGLSWRTASSTWREVPWAAPGDETHQRSILPKFVSVGCDLVIVTMLPIVPKYRSHFIRSCFNKTPRSHTVSLLCETDGEKDCDSVTLAGSMQFPCLELHFCLFATLRP